MVEEQGELEAELKDKQMKQKGAEEKKGKVKMK